jgi:hypothetical protein
MDNDLKCIWDGINDEFFDCRLNAPSDIDWHLLSGADNLEAFGMYLPWPKSIAIDEQFRFDRGRCDAGDEAEMVKVKIVFCLVLHEMIHQSLHQKGEARFGKHGAEFVAEATPISARLGIAPPTELNAHRWPILGDTLAR